MTRYVPDARELEDAYTRAAEVRAELAEAERAAFARWEEALAAYDVARDEASAAYAEWRGADPYA